MRRAWVAVSVFCLLASGFPAAFAQQTHEQVAVRLMLIDALVKDAAGEPVTGLTADDFQIAVGGVVRPLDTLDEICPADGEVVPGLTPRIALVFDYYGLTQRDRQPILQSAAQMLTEQKKPGEEVMIASLTSSLRVEQRFTDDLDLLLDTLQRMEYDNTLATQQFDYLSGKQYFGNWATLLDVLAAYDGSKAVILYSATVTAPGATDALYRDLTTRAAVGRSVIYPAGLRGVRSELPRVGERTLSRLATDTGGDVGPGGRDATRLLEEAVRDLDCRYSLGFYLEAGEQRAPEDIRIAVRREGAIVRFPAQVKAWSPEETRESRTRAAFADPNPFENPVVRAVAYPAGPDSTKTWDTIIVVHAPMPLAAEPQTIDVKGELFREGAKVADISRQIEFEAGSGLQPFTLFGEASVKPGQYEFRVVFSKAGEKRVVSAEARFDIPEVPWGELMLRGPLLARVEKEGRAIRANGEAGTLLKDVIGDQSFEPLTVRQIKSADELLVGWQACRVKKQDPLESGATVERVVIDGDGNVVHRLPAVALSLEKIAAAVECQRGLDKVEAGTLQPGEYTVEVAITRGGERVLEGRPTPLLVD